MNNIRWYHEFDFPNGMKARTHTSDNKFHRALWFFIKKNLNSINFKNKTVLDIGCWDGYWSFYAEKAGAKYVLATDDVTQNWSDGRGIHIAKKMFNSNIEIEQHINVYNIRSLNKKFDIILFLGTYYHLHDPFYALTQIRHCCNEDSIVIIEGDVGCNYHQQEVKYCFGDVTKSIFIPSETIFDQMLQSAYFDIVSFDYFSIVILQAKKSLIHTPYEDRKLIICKPIIETNKLHEYKPPFDLHRYDTRWLEG